MSNTVGDQYDQEATTGRISLEPTSSGHRGPSTRRAGRRLGVLQYDNTAVIRFTFAGSPAIVTTFWPTSICICLPGAVSNRTDATSATRCSRRSSSTARCTVRMLTSIAPCHRATVLAERGDDWREGITEPFRHFGGGVQVVLADNVKALVGDRKRETCTVRFHPAHLAFYRDWSAKPRVRRTGLAPRASSNQA
jgi:hypothetical protein